MINQGIVGDAQMLKKDNRAFGSAHVFDHVERVFIAHVDDGGANLDAARSGAEGMPLSAPLP